ncbi:hypothetical protein [Paenibacillus arenosi]|uniref:Uncharacterized protein n=1 Tax=Paenibacillus arenosi TaxID=2774142 RepID=A0ABR9AZ06_9BACL|nr:hypothetical protein [Paenibacillus arenosi]MBD8498874.1 hypothetical protein [Paenibacillus arenosi]
MTTKMFTLVEGFEGESMAIEVAGDFEKSAAFSNTGMKSITTSKVPRRPAFTIKFNVPYETKMSFIYMVHSSHNYEYHYCHVNNQRKIVGTNGRAWTKYEQVLPAGEHMLKFEFNYQEYYKPGNNVDGIYLDNFTLEMFPLTNPSLIFTDEGGYPYHDAQGNIFKNLDFGTLVAGQTSLPQKVNVYNYSSFDVVKPMVYLKPPEFSPKVKLEISQYSTPFIPENELHFNGTMKDGGHHSFYVRAVSQEDTMSGGNFYIYAKAAPL